VGPFTVDDALPDVMERDGADLVGALRPLAAALPHAPCLDLSPEQDRSLRQGGQPDAAWLAALEDTPGEGALIRLLSPDGRLTAVARLTAEGTRTAAVFAAPAPTPAAGGEDAPCA
jgi:hypothetical protein